MNTTNNNIKYKKIFKEWNENRTPLAYRGIYQYEPMEDEIFRQCYLPKTQKEEPFYKARHSLPKFWFCSNKGTIITVNKGYPELIIGQFDRNDRAQVSFYCEHDTHTVARESIVALVFNDLFDCTDKAKELIEKNGMQAFRRRPDNLGVELHHKNGYIFPEKNTLGSEIFDNIPKNCENIQLVTRLEHNEIHNSQRAAA